MEVRLTAFLARSEFPSPGGVPVGRGGSCLSANLGSTGSGGLLDFTSKSEK